MSTVKKTWSPQKPADQMTDQEIQATPIYKNLEREMAPMVESLAIKKADIKELARKACAGLFNKLANKKVKPLVLEFLGKLKEAGYPIGPKGIRIYPNGKMRRVGVQRKATTGKRGRPPKVQVA